MDFDFLTRSALHGTCVIRLWRMATSTFVGSEIREPGKNLPRSLIIGVIGVVVLYVAVNYVCIRVLGQEPSPLRLLRFRCNEASFGRLGRPSDSLRVCSFDFRISESGHAHRARVYFAMRGMVVFSQRCWGPSNRRCTRNCHCAAGVLAIIIAASCRYESDSQLCCIHRLHFLWG